MDIKITHEDILNFSPSELTEYLEENLTTIPWITAVASAFHPSAQPQTENWRYVCECFRKEPRQILLLDIMSPDDETNEFVAKVLGKIIFTGFCGVYNSQFRYCKQCRLMCEVDVSHTH
jgi:hypothetical protein